VTSLRILMVLGMPWDRRLGAPRVQIELAERFEASGHRVDKLSLEDVFPSAPTSRLRALTRTDFSRAAKSQLRDIAGRYDVIDAQHGDVPFAKHEIGFDGLLVARSCGLFSLYREAERQLAARWPRRTTGNPLIRPYRSLRKRRRYHAQQISLERADLVNVLSVDEQRWVEDHLGLGYKTVHLPNGAYAAYLAALGHGAAGRPRAPVPEVVFVGSWTVRKGILDLPAFIERLRSSQPRLRISLLGTGRSETEVVSDLSPVPEGVELCVVPVFAPAGLPALLRDATAAVLPSYVEGFPLAILELAAAGVPTVAYDVPGPRIILRQIDPGLLAPEGDVYGLVARVEQLLGIDDATYEAVRRRAMEVAASYTWERIADQHLAIYSEALDRLRAS
jgi:glycosyltransferase involved in cell wall biosynthesis